MWNTNFNLSRKYCNNIYFKMHISLNLAILFFAIYVTKRVTPVHKEMCSRKLIHVKTWNVSWISMLFMCRGPANLLCIGPILVYVLPELALEEIFCRSGFAESKNAPCRKKNKNLTWTSSVEEGWYVMVLWIIMQFFLSF